MKVHPFTKALTVTLAAALLLGQVPVVVAAPAQAANITGRVFDKDMKTPAAALTVQAIQEGAKSPIATTRTDARGAFQLASVPAGQYTLLLSDAKGTPVAATRITGQAGVTQTITLALPDRKPGETGTAPGATGSGSWISTPQGATVVVVAAAIILSIAAHQIVKNDNPRTPTSPSAP